MYNQISYVISFKTLDKEIEKENFMFRWFRTPQKPLPTPAPQIQRGEVDVEFDGGQERWIILPRENDLVSGVNLNNGRFGVPDLPPVSDTGPDPLDLMKERLQKKQSAFHADIQSLEEIKEKILIQGPVLETVEKKPQANKSIFQTIEKIAEEILETMKELVEPPKYYLNDLFARSSEHIDEFNKCLNKQLQDLNYSPLSKEEERSLRVAICDTSIEILNGLLALMNGVKSELLYCFKFRKFSEEIALELAELLIKYLLDFSTTLPRSSDYLGEGYQLYEEVHEPLEKISKFMVNIHGNIQRAQKILNQSLQVTAENTDVPVTDTQPKPSASPSGLRKSLEANMLVFKKPDDSRPASPTLTPSNTLQPPKLSMS